MRLLAVGKNLAIKYLLTVEYEDKKDGNVKPKLINTILVEQMCKIQKLVC